MKMKCVKYQNTEEEKIERVPNEVAKRLIETGQAKYTSKGAWKSKTRGKV